MFSVLAAYLASVVECMFGSSGSPAVVVMVAAARFFASFCGRYKAAVGQS